MSILTIKSVSKHFSDNIAVKDVSLEIHSGEFFSILGPSGCGKTTLLRMIAGFESPSSGSILVGGKDITGVAPQKRGIGMVFQNYALFPHMTVFQNVAFGLETKNVSVKEIRLKVESILDAVHLKHKIDVPVPQLSGGEQQRVAVARALVVEPSVLLFDEPLSNLDVALRLSTREEIRSLQRATGITTVYVTHDQSEAMSLSDRIAVMHAGKVIQIGAPMEMYEHPASVFVAEFLGGANVIRGTYDAASRMFTSGSMQLVLPGGKYATSGAIVLAIKPEAMSVKSESGTLRGAVTAKEYLGFTTSLTLDVDGHSVKATCISSDIVRHTMVGAIVPLDVDWTKVSVLPESA